MNKIVKDMAAFRAQAVEGLGGEGLVFQFEEGGEEFVVKHPLLLDEDENERLEKAKGNVAVAKALLGDEAHARFVAAGGRSGDVLLAWRSLTDQMNPK